MRPICVCAAFIALFSLALLNGLAAGAGERRTVTTVTQKVRTTTIEEDFGRTATGYVRKSATILPPDSNSSASSSEEKKAKKQAKKTEKQRKEEQKRMEKQQKEEEKERKKEEKKDKRNSSSSSSKESEETKKHKKAMATQMFGGEQPNGAGSAQIEGDPEQKLLGLSANEQRELNAALEYAAERPNVWLVGDQEPTAHKWQCGAMEKPMYAESCKKWEEMHRSIKGFLRFIEAARKGGSDLAPKVAVYPRFPQIALAKNNNLRVAMQMVEGSLDNPHPSDPPTECLNKELVRRVERLAQLAGVGDENAKRVLMDILGQPDILNGTVGDASAIPALPVAQPTTTAVGNAVPPSKRANTARPVATVKFNAPKSNIGSPQQNVPTAGELPPRRNKTSYMPQIPEKEVFGVRRQSALPPANGDPVSDPVEFARGRRTSLWLNEAPERVAKFSCAKTKEDGDELNYNRCKQWKFIHRVIRRYIKFQQATENWTHLPGDAQLLAKLAVFPRFKPRHVRSGSVVRRQTTQPAYEDAGHMELTQAMREVESVDKMQRKPEPMDLLNAELVAKVQGWAEFLGEYQWHVAYETSDRKVVRTENQAELDPLLADAKATLQKVMQLRNFNDGFFNVDIPAVEIPDPPRPLKIRQDPLAEKKRELKEYLGVVSEDLRNGSGPIWFVWFSTPEERMLEVGEHVHSLTLSVDAAGSETELAEVRKQFPVPETAEEKTKRTNMASAWRSIERTLAEETEGDRSGQYLRRGKSGAEIPLAPLESEIVKTVYLMENGMPLAEDAKKALEKAQKCRKMCENGAIFVHPGECELPKSVEKNRESKLAEWTELTRELASGQNLRLYLDGDTAMERRAVLDRVRRAFLALVFGSPVPVRPKKASNISRMRNVFERPTSAREDLRPIAANPNRKMWKQVQEERLREKAEEAAKEKATKLAEREAIERRRRAAAEAFEAMRAKALKAQMAKANAEESRPFRADKTRKTWEQVQEERREKAAKEAREGEEREEAQRLERGGQVEERRKVEAEKRNAKAEAVAAREAARVEKEKIERNAEIERRQLTAIKALKGLKVQSEAVEKMRRVDFEAVLEKGLPRQGQQKQAPKKGYKYTPDANANFNGHISRNVEKQRPVKELTGHYTPPAGPQNFNGHISKNTIAKQYPVKELIGHYTPPAHPQNFNGRPVNPPTDNGASLSQKEKQRAKEALWQANRAAYGQKQVEEAHKRKRERSEAIRNRGVVPASNVLSTHTYGGLE